MLWYVSSETVHSSRRILSFTACLCAWHMPSLCNESNYTKAKVKNNNKAESFFGFCSRILNLAVGILFPSACKEVMQKKSSKKGERQKNKSLNQEKNKYMTINLSEQWDSFVIKVQNRLCFLTIF